MKDMLCRSPSFPSGPPESGSPGSPVSQWFFNGGDFARLHPEGHLATSGSIAGCQNHKGGCYNVHWGEIRDASDVA